jgi:hypothetical protein
VLIVSLEEGVCMAEVLRRRHAPMADDDALARVAVAGDLARAFWTAALDNGLILGGLSASNLLLRAAGCDNEFEVVSMRCGLAHEVDEQIQCDIRAFASCLSEGPRELLGPLLLERVHLRAGGALEAVHDPDAFAAGVRQLADLAWEHPAQRRSQAQATQPPLRGAALLQRALALAEKHGVRIGPKHLQLAAALAAAHGVCSRLDPVAAGQPLRVLQAVAGLGVTDHATHIPSS